MKVFRSAGAAGRQAPSSVGVIGKFDAMHLGHRRLVSAAVKRARALKTGCLAVTFDPLPAADGAGILTLEERLALLAALGVDAAVLLPFSKRLACLAPGSFARDVLAGALRLIDVYVGENFCFGRDRAGDADLLGELGRELGFSVHALPLARAAGKPVTTERVRALLCAGRRADAAKLLWRPAVKPRRR